MFKFQMNLNQCLPWSSNHALIHTFLFHKKLIHKKLVPGQPNGQETFSTQVMEVKKLKKKFFAFLLQFEDTVTNFEKDMFRREKNF